MRFWTWIPVFFLLQYAVCGQNDPSIVAQPSTVTVLASLESGGDIFGVTIFMDGEIQAGEAPASFEIDPGVSVTFSVSKEGWDFDPAEGEISLSPGEQTDLVFEGRSLRPRIVVAEDFSNINCEHCPAADEAMWEAAGLASGTVMPIAFHGWWTHPLDPFYIYNIPVHRQRIESFYEIEGLPEIRVDGYIVADKFSSAAILANMEARLTLSSRVELALERIDEGETLTLSVSGTVEADPGPGSWRAYLVLYETEVHFEGGSNGQTDFHNTVRHVNMSGEILGEAVDLTPGGSFAVQAEFNPDFEVVVAANLRAMAFIQNSDSKEILEAVIESDGGL